MARMMSSYKLTPRRKMIRRPPESSPAVKAGAIFAPPRIALRALANYGMAYAEAAYGVELTLAPVIKVTWHPNSRWSAYLDLSSIWIGVIDINEERVIERVISEVPVFSFRWSPDGSALLLVDETGSLHIYRTA